MGPAFRTETRKSYENFVCCNRHRPCFVRYFGSGGKGRAAAHLRGNVLSRSAVGRLCFPGRGAKDAGRRRGRKPHFSRGPCQGTTNWAVPRPRLESGRRLARGPRRAGQATADPRLGRRARCLLVPFAAGAAYRIMQQPGEAMVKRLKKDPRSILVSLAATDDRRGLRLPHGAYQVRWQDGAVVVTKGNVRLMTVPLEGPLKDLYIEVPNDAMLQDLALLPSGPVPEETCARPPRRPDGTRPAELPWRQEAAERSKPAETGQTVAWNWRRRTTTETALVTSAGCRAGLVRSHRSGRRCDPWYRPCLARRQRRTAGRH